MGKEKRFPVAGLSLIASFILLTVLVQTVDVRPFGVNGTDIGFASFNCRFHGLFGVNMTMYEITDWMGVVPIAVCMVFGFIGLRQWIRRKNILKVDRDILLLGVYYILVIIGYAVFEMVPINYRPVLIDGYMEASYPSSTTLLVLSVMPTLTFQAERRLCGEKVRRVINVLSYAFMAFMVIGRLTCGVHWFTDILGGVLLSAGLFNVYRAAVGFLCN